MQKRGWHWRRSGCRGVRGGRIKEHGRIPYGIRTAVSQTLGNMRTKEERADVGEF